MLEATKLPHCITRTEAELPEEGVRSSVETAKDALRKNAHLYAACTNLVNQDNLTLI